MAVEQLARLRNDSGPASDHQTIIHTFSRLFQKTGQNFVMSDQPFRSPSSRYDQDILKQHFTGRFRPYLDALAAVHDVPIHGNIVDMEIIRPLPEHRNWCKGI